MMLFRRQYRGADGTVRTSTKWSARFSVRGRVHEVALGYTDKRAAEMEAQRLLREAEHESADPDPFRAHRETPLTKHVEAFEATLKSRERAEQYVRERLVHVRAFLTDTGASQLRDLDPARVAQWIETLKAPIVVGKDVQGKNVTRTRSARTLNSRIRALRQFSRWLYTCRRIAFDPLVSVKEFNEAVDRRRVRRALTPQEFSALLVAAAKRPLEVEGPNVTEERRALLAARGRSRALVYLVLGATGLRVGELRALTWGDLDLDRALVTVPAKVAKSRKEQSIDLHPIVVAALECVRPPTVSAADAIFPPGSFPNVATFYRDLTAAGIAKVGEDRRRVDRHALRHSFVSWLASSGVHPRVAQALARHSDIRLTLGTYTDPTLLSTKAAVATLKLPALASLSLPLSLPGATSSHARAASDRDERDDESAPNRRVPCEDVQESELEMVGAPGIEPGTASLKGCCSTS